MNAFKFFVIIFAFIEVGLFANGNIDEFFNKIMDKKIERLKTEIKDLPENTQKEIIDTILKYDRIIFKLRKKAIKKHGRGKKNCLENLNLTEERLLIRKKILEQQLKKLSELKRLNIKCERLVKIIKFERRFMMKLRKRMMRHHRRGRR